MMPSPPLLEYRSPSPRRHATTVVSRAFVNQTDMGPSWRDRRTSSPERRRVRAATVVKVGPASTVECRGGGARKRGGEHESARARDGAPLLVESRGGDANSRLGCQSFSLSRPPTAAAAAVDHGKSSMVWGVVGGAAPRPRRTAGSRSARTAAAARCSARRAGGGTSTCSAGRRMRRRSSRCARTAR